MCIFHIFHVHIYSGKVEFIMVFGPNDLLKQFENHGYAMYIPLLTAHYCRRFVKVNLVNENIRRKSYASAVECKRNYGSLYSSCCRIFVSHNYEIYVTHNYEIQKYYNMTSIGFHT